MWNTEQSVKYNEQQMEFWKSKNVPSNIRQDKMMKKGLLGCNLANQVIVIGIAFSVSVPFTSWAAIKNFSSEIYNCSLQALSLMGIIFGFLLVSHPEKFSGVQQTSYETMPTGVAAG